MLKRLLAVFGPEQPRALQAAVHLLSKVGGILGRKCDGQPGAETLWRG